MQSTDTIKSVLNSAKKQLNAIESASTDCEVLLSSLLQCTREHLYSYPEQKLPPDLVCDFNSLTRKRSKKYPVSYLTGIKEFWSTNYLVNSSTLIPRPETELLVEKVLGLIDKGSPAEILDLGTGCGAIAIALAKERPNTRITAVDISPEAVEMTRENAQKNKIENICLLVSDWYSEIGNKTFDVIVSNPPYVESDDNGFTEGEIRFEPRIALDGGPVGMNALNHIVPTAARYLNSHGCLLIEHGYNQGLQVRELFKQYHYQNIRTETDYSGHERFTYGDYWK